MRENQNYFKIPQSHFVGNAFFKFYFLEQKSKSH